MNFELKRQNRKILWESGQIDYILKAYEMGTSLIQLGKEFSCSKDAIRTLLVNNGIKIKTRSERYPRDSAFFNIINTPEKAYWLGFFYADGCVAAPTASNPNLIELASKDKEHLEKFKQAIKANGHKISSAILRDKEYYQFNIQDQQLHNDLISHGCIPQKSNILMTIPDIPEELFGHFLRGYFDGDGSINYDASRDVYRISFVSGSLPYIEDLRHKLQVDRLSISISNGNTLSIVARNDVYRILKLIYDDSEEQIRLNRKYKIYQNYLAWYKEKEDS